MDAPKAGNYIFIHHGYGGESLTPQLALLAEGAEQLLYMHPRGQTLTLTFDVSQRYCTGWHDLANANNYPCPDNASLPTQYEQCRHCQQKTGFNPAFYHATTISPQQAARNLQPHTLYLAHFAPGVIKVGITWAKRGIGRLLDQGARTGLIIKTFPTANVARRYEVQTAKLDGIIEMVQPKVKHRLLQQPYDPVIGATELHSARERLVRELGITVDNNAPLHLDRYYLMDSTLAHQNLVESSNAQTISGRIAGMVGSTLVVEQDSLHFLFPLGKWTGYKLSLSYQETRNQHQPHQTSLF